ncbi:MAG: 30S ribosome-binding factor RbfA [Kiritimatiellia bacterium]
MSVKRLDRVNSLLRREIGEALYQVFAGEDFDLGSVTVTEVNCASNLRNAIVRVSIFGHDEERGRMINRLSRKAKDLQAVINRDLKLKYTPRLQFKLDLSLEKGDHVLDILSRMKDDSEEKGDTFEEDKEL